MSHAEYQAHLYDTGYLQHAKLHKKGMARKDQGLLFSQHHPAVQNQSRPFVFCNFNQLAKLDPELFHVWISVLKRVPGSLMWLLALPEDGVENVLNEADKVGMNSRFRYTFVVPS